MTMTDPIADFLTRLRNANSAYHDEVTLPHSKIKANIAEILKAEGYITDYHTEDARVGKSLIVELKYGPSRERSIAGLRRVSKPGLRVYAKKDNLPRVLGGLGVGPDDAKRTVQRFREHDERALIDQLAIRDDEKQLIQNTAQTAAELRSLFEADLKR